MVDLKVNLDRTSKAIPVITIFQSWESRMHVYKTRPKPQPNYHGNEIRAFGSFNQL